MTAALLILAGFVAGFLNVMAGGGSFITLPALVATGLPAVVANATSTVGMFPSQVATAFVARKDLRLADNGAADVSFTLMCVISVVGGAIGGALLLVTPQALFTRIIPWLILFATVLFAAGSTILAKSNRLKLGRRGIYVSQGIVATYGGYFGGGIGILMLAALTLYGLRDLRVMNNMKIVWAVLMNVAACATFAFTSLVHWLPAALLTTGSLAGGYAGLLTARRLPAIWVRRFVIVVGLGLSLYFFLR